MGIKTANKYLLSTYSVPGTVLSTGNTVETIQALTPGPQCLLSNEKDRHETNYQWDKCYGKGVLGAKKVAQRLWEQETQTAHYRKIKSRASMLRTRELNGQTNFLPIEDITAEVARQLGRSLVWGAWLWILWDCYINLGGRTPVSPAWTQSFSGQQVSIGKCSLGIYLRGCGLLYFPS